MGAFLNKENVINKDKEIHVVEDEEISAEILKWSFRDFSNNLKIFSSGESFFNNLKNNKPNLVILDIGLPGMSGLQVCSKLKSNPVTELIPVIILTSQNSVEDRIKSIQAGANDYLTKPVNWEELKTRVSVLLKE